MTPAEYAARLADLMPDPVERERAARDAIAIFRAARADALNELHRRLGSWQKVGDAVGLPRQDAWRMAKR
jgi:hypothetical protein